MFALMESKATKLWNSTTNLTSTEQQLTAQVTRFKVVPILVKSLEPTSRTKENGSGTTKIHQAYF